MLPAVHPLALEASDGYDATVTKMHFLVRRERDPSWRVLETSEQQGHVMAYAVSGRALYQCGEESFTAVQGDLLLFPKGLRRSGKSDLEEPWTFFSVGFDLHFPDDMTKARFAALPHRTTCDNELELLNLFNELERVWLAKAPGYTLRGRSILMYLLSLFVRNSIPSVFTVPHAQKLALVVRRLQEDFSHTYSVAELAAMADLSPSRFRALFKELTGHSVTRFQNWLRINRAKDLLLSGEYTVSETAERLGFSDVYYFSKLFKKMAGVSPSSYRQR